MSSQSFQPALLDTGWGQCDGTDKSDSGDQLDFINVFTNGMGMILSPAIGVYVDAVGPRVMGIVGALLGTLGYVLLAVTMYHPCTFGDGIWGYMPLNVAGSFYMYAPLVYLYVLPEYSFTASAIYNTAFVLADLYGSVAAVVHGTSPPDDTQTSVAYMHGSRTFVGDYFSLMAIGTFVFSLLGCAFLVPSKATCDAIKRQASEASSGRKGSGTGDGLGDVGDAAWSGKLEAGSGEGLLSQQKRQLEGSSAAAKTAKGGVAENHEASAAGSRSAEEPRPCRELEIFSDAWTVVTRLVGLEGVLLFIHVFAVYMLQLNYQLEMYEYYRGLFGPDTSDPEHRARRLVGVFGMLYEAVGVPSCLLFGLAADRLGTVQTVLRTHG